MNNLTDEILEFLKGNGFNCSIRLCNDMEVICTATPDNPREHFILPIKIQASDTDEAAMVHARVEKTVKETISLNYGYPMIITEDRWHSHGDMMKKRILSHLEIFSPIYARNCEIRRIDKAVAKEFLEANHSYGYAACRYCYGMFLKRHTGHAVDNASIIPGTLVAVATFSNARKWIKDDKTIRSYEWTRYASLPEVRLCGGMGKMLKTFIKDIQPDDIMSYADLEWSAGDVYRQLGFELEGKKAPVLFTIDTDTWRRTPIKQGASYEVELTSGERYFQNLGSNKYRLKLTEY